MYVRIARFREDTKTLQLRTCSVPTPRLRHNPPEDRGHSRTSDPSGAVLVVVQILSHSESVTP
jgi:hypothetical protein